MNVNRRKFVLSFIAGAVAPIVLAALNKVPLLARFKKYLRPPGALSEKDFIDACIGCGQCANVCPNKCISMQGIEKGLENLATPFIVPRARGCVLCMACTQACPTGALKKLPATKEGMLAVTMGKAVVSEDICYSFSGRTCGACYRACPIAGTAMKIGLFEKPYVQDECVGCGLCEQACIHMPQAIRIIPWADLKEEMKNA